MRSVQSLRARDTILFVMIPFCDLISARSGLIERKDHHGRAAAASDRDPVLLNVVLNLVTRETEYEMGFLLPKINRDDIGRFAVSVTWPGNGLRRLHTLSRYCQGGE